MSQFDLPLTEIVPILVKDLSVLRTTTGTNLPPSLLVGSVVADKSKLDGPDKILDSDKVLECLL